MFNYGEYYKRIAPIYNEVRLDKEPEFSKTISTIMSNSNIGAKALDIGCGSGAYTASLLKIGYDIIGVDKSVEQIANAKKVISAFVGNAISLPFENQSLDLCLMIMMLHQIPSYEIKNALSETYRILKNGGKLIIKTQSHENLKLHWDSSFFPKAYENNIARYPCVSTLVNHLSMQGEVKVLHTHTKVIYSIDEILDRLQKKNNSTVAMLTSQEFENGFRKIKDYYNQFDGQVTKDKYHTYIVATKERC
ncbi:MAG: methyltransferase domain-containing protein [Nitrososphaerota archaeon]|jgi:ubiquinone/menaquinone biosynthesis C-methylase UbiE|nr:methyltransferase domain-containing protein [Nitrososphaerota archaeon]